MALRAVIADTQKMFAEGVQTILTELSMQSIKIVGIAFSMMELKMMHSIGCLIMDITIAEQESHKIISELKSENWVCESLFYPTSVTQNLSGKHL